MTRNLGKLIQVCSKNYSLISPIVNNHIKVNLETRILNKSYNKNIQKIIYQNLLFFSKNKFLRLSINR